MTAIAPAASNECVFRQVGTFSSPDLAARNSHNNPRGIQVITDGAAGIDVATARRLRDWLNSALPDEDHAPHTSVAEVRACPICSPPAASAAAPHVHAWAKAPDSDLALCVCGDYSDDWYCPDSPDLVCHYRYGNMDQCDHCGLPEERK